MSLRIKSPAARRKTQNFGFFNHSVILMTGSFNDLLHADRCRGTFARVAAFHSTYWCGRASPTKFVFGSGFAMVLYELEYWRLPGGTSELLFKNRALRTLRLCPQTSSEQKYQNLLPEGQILKILTFNSASATPVFALLTRAKWLSFDNPGIFS